jgi:hypothetical protein
MLSSTEGYCKMYGIYRYLMHTIGVAESCRNAGIGAKL